MLGAAGLGLPAGGSLGLTDPSSGCRQGPSSLQIYHLPCGFFSDKILLTFNKVPFSKLNSHTIFQKYPAEGSSRIFRSTAPLGRFWRVGSTDGGEQTRRPPSLSASLIQ